MSTETKQPFTTLAATYVVVPVDNIDTDQIIPARFLKVTDKKGLGDSVFCDWRKLPDGSLNADFPLNRPDAQGAQILVAGANFGCGSSREHAPWALVGWGLRAIIAPSFADIFKGNAMKNGLLPIAVDAAFHARLLEARRADPKARIAVDLPAQTVALAGDAPVRFAIDPFAKACLVNGVDELGYLLDRSADIARYEATHPYPALVRIYDTTLRDGTQREGLSLSAADKIRIAHLLDAMGVAFVELGWPGSNPKDVEAFERARDAKWSHAAVTAFGSTRRAGVSPDADPQVRALLETGAPVCTIFGKSSLLHVREVLRIAPDENLRMIAETVGYLAANGRRVIYDAEHFFDGWREDPSFALETIRAAAGAGAETVVLCDTNGGSLPWEIEERVREVVAALGVPIGIHAHDDTGCGVANSVAAVRAGATHVQGTLNGYGERCGNANLCWIMPNLELKMGRRCLREGALGELAHVAWQVAEIANLAPDAHAAYVGRSAFAHKGGVHVAAIRRHPRAYEHVDPTLVGNKTRVVVSELSGRGNLQAKAEEFAVELEAGATNAVLRDLKEREARGFSFEAAEASVALMMRRESTGYAAPFELVDYKVIVGQREREGAFSEATIKLRVQGEIVHTAAEGNGPVGALDAALRKALSGAYPQIAGIRLEDYKVRILDSVSGTAAITRVMIDTSYGEERWSTVGASPNVLEASWLALADGIEYGLSLARASRPPSSRPVDSGVLDAPAKATLESKGAA